jgi:hypothetical protein
MGGQIAVGFRFKSGETVCYETHTNHLPHWLKSKAVLHDRDEAHIKAYIEKALVEYTDSFIPVPVAPIGYGLVFYDFMKHRLYNRQNYFNPVRFFDIDAISKKDHVIDLIETCGVWVSYYVHAKEAWGEPVFVRGRQEGEILVEMIQDKTNEYYRRRFSGDENARMFGCQMDIASGFAYQDFNRDRWLPYMKMLEQDGIEISGDAQTIWARAEQALEDA